VRGCSPLGELERSGNRQKVCATAEIGPSRRPFEPWPIAT